MGKTEMVIKGRGNHYYSESEQGIRTLDGRTIMLGDLIPKDLRTNEWCADYGTNCWRKELGVCRFRDADGLCRPPLFEFEIIVKIKKIGGGG